MPHFEMRPIFERFQKISAPKAFAFWYLTPVRKLLSLWEGLGEGKITS
jgi:hypothetical protein